MALPLSTIAARISANAAAVAAACSPAITTAEAQGLVLVLQALGRRPDVFDQIIALAFSRQVSPTDPSPPAGTNQVTGG